MNRIDRLTAFITVLQSRKYATAEMLAAHFAISVRTVYRDLKSLSEIGIPIGFEPNQGYFIVSGYFLPPVSFTGEEANALVIMETLAGKYGDQSIQTHFSTALQKVKAVLKEGQRDKVEHLHSQIRIYQPPEKAPEVSHLTTLQNSITNCTVLHLKYRSRSGEISEREVEPIGLTYYAFDWHLIAWCWLRGAYRDFKNTHILDLVDTQQPFRKSDHLDLNSYIQSLT